MLELFLSGKIEGIQKRMQENPRAWEPYASLAAMLENVNGKQAYLCYENALFYCSDVGQKSMLTQRMELMRQKGYSVPAAGIVILNYNLLEDLQNCIESIRSTSPETARQIIVVDNGSEDGSVQWMETQPDIRLRKNTDNAGFPKGCNQGVELADPDMDILLLNNDTIVCINALFWLRMGLYEREDIGTSGCVTNRANNSQIVYDVGLDIPAYQEYAWKNNVIQPNYLEEKIYLVGFAVLIRRTAMDAVGLLDERFSPGNYEDNDYGMRMLTAGYDNVLVHNSFIIHLGSKSFLKRTDYGNVVARNAKFFDRIYGKNTHHFVHVNGAVETAMNLAENLPEDASVLGLNCELGASLLHLQWLRPKMRVSGLTCLPSGGRIGGHYKTVPMDYYQDPMHFPQNPGKYDLILLQTRGITEEDLPAYLDYCADHLKKDGRVVLMVGNRKHFNYWLPFILYGETAFEVENVGPDSAAVRQALDASRLGIKQWYFYFTFPEKSADLVKMIAENKEGDKNDAYIRDHLIFAATE